MEKLSLHSYEQLGESIQVSIRHLTLILKILQASNIDIDSLRVEGDVLDKIVTMNCDLSNLSRALDKELDIDYPDKIIETVGYFN